MTSVELGEWAYELILARAAGAHPEEACGILIGRADADRVHVVHALPCRNHAPPAERGRRFEIDPRAVLNVQRELRKSGQAVVGFYHSHPDGSATPSATDLEYVRLWPETAWLIAGVSSEGQTATLRGWWLDADAGDSVRELRIVAPAPAHGLECPD